MARWVEQIAQCRGLVAALGEGEHWWRSQALDPTGLKFLVRLFPRTAHLAAVETASLAARTEHDKAPIHVNNFHLFRLPVNDEAEIRTWFESVPGRAFLAALPDQSRAERLASLRLLAGDQPPPPKSAAGPINLGAASSLRRGQAAARFAAAYVHSIERERVYPYLADNGG